MPETPSSVPVRERAGLVLAPALAALIFALPIPWPAEQHHLLAIFVGIVTLWVTEAIPIPATALLVAPLLIAANITDSKSAFAPYADPLLFLFVGGFFFARAMSRHGLDKRVATRLTSFSFLQGRPSLLVLAFLVTAALLSMWVSNTATAAILAPLLLGAGASASGAKSAEDSPATSNQALLGLAYACSVGGLGTLMGSPPNGITARLLSERLGEDFGFLEWMAVGLPVAVVLLAVVSALVLRGGAPDLGMISKAAKDANSAPVPTESAQPASQEPVESASPSVALWSRGERITGLALGLAVFLWLSTGLSKAFGGEVGAAIAGALPGGAVAILASSLLFFFRDDSGEIVLPWSDAVKIDWGIILLFGGGISLGTQLFETGLASSLAEGFVAMSGIESLWTLTFGVTFFTIFFTEVCSNTASSAMLVPLVIAIADELSVSPVPPALAVGLAASCAFALPIATGPNAIVYGTGAVKLQDMMRTGLVLNLICAVLICVMLYLLLPIYGFGA